MRYQVRDTRFGLALYEGESGVDALTDFLHVRERADVRGAIKVVRIEDDGTVEANYKGLRLYAVPVGASS